MRRALLYVLLCCSLTACGFQLRGQVSLGGDLGQVHLVATPSDFTRYLEEGLKRAAITLDPGADIQLHILEEQVTRQTSTLDRSARAAEYTVLLTIRYQLRQAGAGNTSQPVAPERNLTLRRTYQFDNTRIVGKQDEEALLIQQLRQQAAIQVVNQVARTQRAQLTLPTP